MSKTEGSRCLDFARHDSGKFNTITNKTLNTITTMKVIHTSDWHLGQSFFGFDRREDHVEMIEQLEALVREEKPDVLIVAGDVYDIAAPNTGVQKDFADYMVKLHNAIPEMMIVCISGNHDSASRHEIFQSPWEALGVKMLGKIDRERLADNIIQVPGSMVDKVVKVPFEWVLDAVEVFDGRSSANQKRLVPSLDAGYVTQSDIFLGHSLRRNVDEQATAVAGYEVLADTNNSLNDFYESEKQSLHE